MDSLKGGQGFIHGLQSKVAKVWVSRPGSGCKPQPGLGVEASNEGCLRWAFQTTGECSKALDRVTSLN